MDTFVLDNLPPREQWPVLTEMDYPAQLNAAVELLGGPWADRPCVLAEETWTYAELRSFGGKKFFDPEIGASWLYDGD